MSNILVIDNDVDICETISSLVVRQNHKCSAAHTLAEGLRLLKTIDFSLVFLDLSLPDGNGLSFLTTIKESFAEPEVIILTGKGDLQGAEQAIQDGAWDFLVKPTSIEQISLSMQEALNFHTHKREEASQESIEFDRIIGKSPEMMRCYDLAADAARSEANVLIDGETGTGKELFAQVIHEKSSRADNNFVVVDCASLTEGLVESTLFGHAKGSFTGADYNKMGLIPLANKGTLFLDEIGELPLLIQKHLLRVLQERVYRPVGETQESTSDFRLIAATNKDLNEMVKEGTFREDLLYRIKTVHVSLPPVRAREGDVRELTEVRLQQLHKQYKWPEKKVEAGFFEVLENYDWPGNVRQLFNIVERAFVTSGNSSTIHAKYLPSELRISMAKSKLEGKFKSPSPSSSKEQSSVVGGECDDLVQDKDAPYEDLPTLKAYKESSEKVYLEKMLLRYQDDIATCLSVSGLSRSHFYVLLKKHGIKL